MINKKEKVNYRILKLIFLPLVILYIDSVVLIFFHTELGCSFYYSAPLAIMDIFFAIDIFIRPGTARVDKFIFLNLVIPFVIFPVFVALPYIENRFLKIYFDSIIFFIMGSVAEICGGVLLFLARRQLGRLGSTIIAIEKEHKLITDGAYKYIRNPIYAGILLLILGYGISLQGIFSTIILEAGIFTVCIMRINAEEKILGQAFGNEYLKYKHKTKRLIPFIY